MLGGYFIRKRSRLSDEVEPLFVPGTLCPEGNRHFADALSLGQPP